MEPKGQITLVYFVVDQSRSMGQWIAELNQGLITLLDGLQKQPFAAAKLRFSVIGFSDTAHTYMEPSDFRSVPEMPVLHTDGGTSYAAAFNELGRRIDVDLPSLITQGYSVVRAIVFFLTDGRPDARQEWRAARRSVLDSSIRPAIVALGIGDADAAIVAEIASSPDQALVAQKRAGNGEALTRFFAGLPRLFIGSGQSAAAGIESEMEN